MGIERLPAKGPDVGGRAGDDEENSHEPDGPGTIDARQESFAQNHVEHRGKNEGYGDDKDPV